ncbi:MAG: hypothetical protein QS748_01540 [Candidatus Endonucleobacter bathymodioli]|uniref:FimV N-terminal domain-containing protein n=1 Tax=Candidatus Endonucleibacter bathymodioli TaxID=539814 RepID=A0AA90NRJ0_9GAMM|nr:hypothetical protein [Candidatus Endonucleobacter bathymodioli]
MKVGLKILSLLISLGFISVSYATEIGMMNILSSSDEPFEANITISKESVNETGPLIVSIASKIDFMRNRMARSYYIADLKASIEKNHQGDNIIKIKGSQPMYVRNINLLVMMLTSKEKYFGKYSFVLPQMGDAKGKITVAKNRMMKNVNTQIQIAQTDNNHTHNIPNKSKQKNNDIVINDSKGVTSYKVLPGDSLSHISMKLLSKYPNIKSWEELMNFLIEINKGVFPNNDINKLKIATILNLPDTSVGNNNLSITQSLLVGNSNAVDNTENNNTQKTIVRKDTNSNDLKTNWNTVKFFPVADFTPYTKTLRYNSSLNTGHTHKHIRNNKTHFINNQKLNYNTIATMGLNKNNSIQYHAQGIFKGKLL